MSWTDTRISIATRMWAGGSSASEIAQELGGLTRNAVLGLLNRRGLLGTRAKDQSKSEAAQVTREVKLVATNARPDERTEKLNPRGLLGAQAKEQGKTVAAQATREVKLGATNAWPDERTEKLKKLWADGRSASEIGKSLGVTRLAVIGKAHRMGLTAGTRLTASAPPARTRTVPSAPKVPAAPRARILDATGDVVGTAPAPLPPPEKAVVGQAVVMSNIVLGEDGFLVERGLRSSCCKYPVGDDPPIGEGHLQLFCAAPTGDATHSYCEQHRAIAFKSVTPAEKAKRLRNDVGAAHRDMLVRNTRRHSTGTRAVF